MDFKAATAAAVVAATAAANTTQQIIDAKPVNIDRYHCWRVCTDNRCSHLARQQTAWVILIPARVMPPRACFHPQSLRIYGARFGASASESVRRRGFWPWQAVVTSGKIFRAYIYMIL